jgi:hypothetical protein
VTGTAPAASQNPGKLILNGLLVEGSIQLAAGNLGGFQVVDCTIVPPAGISVNASSGLANNALSVVLERTICGPITLATSVPALNITDSIIDARTGAAITAAGADASIQSSTIFGTVGSAATNGTRTLQAGNSIFTGIVNVERTQSGCVRFCFVRSDLSRIPRRYRCQPDLAIAGISDPGIRAAAIARVTPSFTSSAYGDPAYAQLSTSCPSEISSGADNRAEMGAFYFLQQPQRDTNLRVALQEYLRFGLQAGIFYVT